MSVISLDMEDIAVYNKYEEKEFAQRSQAEDWAKTQKKRMQAADFSVKYNVSFQENLKKWKAIIYIDDKRK